MPEKFKGDTPPQERNEFHTDNPTPIWMKDELKAALKKILHDRGGERIEDNYDAPQLKFILDSLEQTGVCEMDRALRHIEISRSWAEKESERLKQDAKYFEKLQTNLK